MYKKVRKLLEKKFFMVIFISIWTDWIWIDSRIFFPSQTTREFCCLAGEPKHFPFDIVFVLIIKIALTCTRGFPKEVAAKMAAAQGFSDVIFLRGSYLSCHFLRKAPLTRQSDFNDQNKNNCKGKCFGLRARPRDSLVFRGNFVLIPKHFPLSKYFC